MDILPERLLPSGNGGMMTLEQLLGGYATYTTAARISESCGESQRSALVTTTIMGTWLEHETDPSEADDSLARKVSN